MYQSTGPTASNKFVVQFHLSIYAHLRLECLQSIQCSSQSPNFVAIVLPLGPSNDTPSAFNAQWQLGPGRDACPSLLVTSAPHKAASCLRSWNQKSSNSELRIRVGPRAHEYTFQIWPATTRFDRWHHHQKSRFCFELRWMNGKLKWKEEQGRGTGTEATRWLADVFKHKVIATSKAKDIIGYT